MNLITFFRWFVNRLLPSSTPELKADWWTISDYPKLPNLDIRPKLKGLLRAQRVEMDYALTADDSEFHPAFNHDHLIMELLTDEEVQVYKGWVQARRNRADRVLKNELPAPTA